MGLPRCLLLSNSRLGTKYLDFAEPIINKFLTEEIKQILFIPFAAVTFSWDKYVEKVQNGLPKYKIIGIHQTKNYAEAVKSAQAILIGGGNTFQLLKHLQDHKLIEPIRDRVINHGIPYIGWSAGSNVATPDIGSTNDMPITWPKTDEALNFVPFNLNPHYNQWKPENYQGEGRDDRLNECVLVRKNPILAITEGVGVLVEHGKYLLIAPELPPGVDVKRFAKMWLPDTSNEDGFKVIDVDLNTDIKPLIS